MKNYYDQLNELQIAYARLNSLKEKKKLYFQMTQPKSPANLIGFTESGIFDIFGNYVSQVEKIDKEIDAVEAEISVLKKNLDVMTNSLRQMDSSLEKIFVLKYVDGLSVNQICRRINYSPAHVYRKLAVIEKMIKNEKNFVL